MKKANCFYVVYPSDEKIKSLISGIRVLSDQNQRTQAHITVRGPYTKKLSSKFINKASRLIFKSEVEIHSIASFFEGKQNTVFLSCISPALKPIWKKKSYKGFNPHITIYDGENRSLASNIKSILTENFRGFNFMIEKLEWLEPNDMGELDLFHLKTNFDFSNISEYLKTEITYDILLTISNEQRLRLIEKLAQILFNISTKEL